MAARVTMATREAVREDPALKASAELLLDVALQ
jgi:hypothetical protein